jgi:preprotein translocase subunit SecD
MPRGQGNFGSASTGDWVSAAGEIIGSPWVRFRLVGRRAWTLVACAALLAAVAMGCDSSSSDETACTDAPDDGRELTFRATPEPSAAEMSETVEILCRRVRATGIEPASVHAQGADTIEITVPEDEANRAAAQLGNPASLYIYDWEPNVIPNPAAKDPAETPFPRIYDAAQLASRQAPECFKDLCSTDGPTFYLFDRPTKEWLSGPVPTESALASDPASAPPPERREAVTVPRGIRVIQAESPTGEVVSDPNESGWYVIRDRPELTNAEITRPEQNFDPLTNQPNLTFEFTEEGQEAFSVLTGRVAERGREAAPPSAADNPALAAAYSDHFAIVIDDAIAARPIVNSVENPSGIDARVGASISAPGDLQETRDLAEYLKIPAPPVSLTLVSGP